MLLMRSSVRWMVLVPLKRVSDATFWCANVLFLGEMDGAGASEEGE